MNLRPASWAVNVLFKQNMALFLFLIVINTIFCYNCVEIKEEFDMGKHISITDVLELSISERIQLIEDAWDTITKVPEEVHLTEEQKKEIDRRLVSYHRNPNAGLPWNEIKQKILNQK